MRRASLHPRRAALAAGCAGLQSSSDNAAVAELKNTAASPWAPPASAGGERRAHRGGGPRLPPGPHGGTSTPSASVIAGLQKRRPSFQPADKQHGALNPQGSHAGDLPNLTVAPDGTGRMETTTEQLSLGSGR